MDYRIVKNESRSKESQNVNQVIPVSLDGTFNMIPISNLSRNLNVAGLFEEEQNLSDLYRMQGDVNIVASNVLFNYDGEDSAETIFGIMDYALDTQDYLFSFDEVIKSKDGWFYYLDVCANQYMKPYPNDFNYLSSGAVPQWDTFITYEAEKNLVPIEINGLDISQGIPIYSGTTVTIDDKEMLALICYYSHNLSIGDSIELSSNTSTLDGQYSIEALGLNGEFDDSIFVIDINPSPMPNFSVDGYRIKKVINGYISEYYSLWNKKLSQYQPKKYKTGFAQNVFSDRQHSYTFNEDIDINGLLDENGKPIDKLYTTFLKKQAIDAALWTKVSSGINSPNLQNPFDIVTINSTTDSVESNVTSINEYFFNGIYEYNPYVNYKQLLNEGCHRLNTINREDNNFLEGYYYNPHYPYQIRTYGDFVNQSFSGETFVPDYADIVDGLALWRDLYNKNYEQNIPFMNGCHYTYQKNVIFVKRQDPCKDYSENEVYSYVSGDCEYNEDLQENEIQNICK